MIASDRGIAFSSEQTSSTALRCCCSASSAVLWGNEYLRTGKRRRIFAPARGGSIS